MSDFETVEKSLSDPATLARFVADPKAVATELGVDVSSRAEVLPMERFARSAQLALTAAAESAGVGVKLLNWGIGAGCCNGATLRFAKGPG